MHETITYPVWTYTTEHGPWRARAGQMPDETPARWKWEIWEGETRRWRGEANSQEHAAQQIADLLQDTRPA